MRSITKDQLGGLGTFGSAVLILVAFLLPGAPPKFAASTPTLVVFFHDHHARVLISVLLIEIGVAGLLLCLPHVVLVIRRSGDEPAATVVSIAVTAMLATLAVAAALYGALAQLAISGDTRSTVHAFYELSNFAQLPWLWASLAVVVGVSLATWRGAFPRFVVGLNAVIGVLLFLGGISVKADGVFAAGTGALCAIAAFAWLVFLLELAWLLWKSEPAPAVV